MNSCPKNLTQNEIFMEFGKDDDMGKCNSCPNLSYKCGMMTCKLIEERSEEKLGSEAIVSPPIIYICIKII